MGKGGDGDGGAVRRRPDGAPAAADDALELPSKATAKLGRTEVAINGNIYDLAGFEHPGGDVVQLFGGNECTETYRMIHPHHDGGLEKLSAMKLVGKVSDYAPEYTFDTPFEREIKREVFKIVKRGREFGTPGYFFRAACYVGALCVLQALWVTQGSSVKLAVALGVVQAMIGLNVQHDANHGAASRNPTVNMLMGFGADFIGGARVLWMEQHWTHHTFTNHRAKDPDAVSGEPLLLFNDYPLGHPARKFHHKFQAFFFLPALSFYWLSSIFNPQILDLQHRGAESVGVKMNNDWIESWRMPSVAMRALYLSLNIVPPFVHHGVGTALFHTWLMGACLSITLSMLFSLSHNFEQVDRDPTKSFREGGDKAEKICWFKAQVETSSTYGGAISGYLTGGLNFQVEHHLFPRMCSAWYPYIAPTVRAICAKHGVRYVYYPWVHQNFVSTLRYMHASGNGLNWMELDPLAGN